MKIMGKRSCHKICKQPLFVLMAAISISLLSGCSTTIKQVEVSEPSFLSDEIDFTDSALSEGIKSIERMQQQLHMLQAEQGLDTNDYLFCKAHAWLDMAYTEYTDNDRTGIAPAAQQQAYYIINQIKQGGRNLGFAMPEVVASTRVREDLWQVAEAYKSKKEFTCFACQLAKLEVQLVWAGHEYFELGARHALSAEQTADRYARELKESQHQCANPVIVASQPEITQLPAMPRSIHFAVNEALIDHASQSLVEQMAVGLLQYPNLDILLIGHADYRGAERHNIQLSQRRAEAVTGRLVALGVERARIRIKAIGSILPESKGRTAEDLARNRRVELILLPSAMEIPTDQIHTDLKVEATSDVDNKNRDIK